MRFYLLLLLALAGCGNPVDAPLVLELDAGTTPDVTTEPDVAVELTGEQLYQANCASCHGVEGTGGTTWSGSIQGLKFIAEIAVEGRGTMVPVAITTEEADRVQDYIDSFGVDVSRQTGREVFANRCAPCHGARGEGTAASYPSQFMHPDLAEWVVRNGRGTDRFPGPMPSYGEDEVSQAQFDEMLEFMWGQPRQGGGEGLYVAFCQNCHGVNGRGGYAGHLVFGRDPTTLVRNGHGGTNFEARSSYMPSWTTQQISDLQLETLRSYLLGQ